MSEHHPITTISQEHFDEVFAELKARPSYLQIAQAREPQADSALTDWYHSAVNAARGEIYDIPESKEHQETADMQLLDDIFGGSAGSEFRLVTSGFKPASWISMAFDKSDIIGIQGSIPVDYTGTDAIITHGIPHPNIGFTTGDINNDNNPYMLARGGFVYNKAAISDVATQNADIHLPPLATTHQNQLVN